MGQVDQQARPPNYMNVDNKPGPVYNPMFNTINVESSSQIDSASMYNQGAVVKPISRTFGNLPQESSSLLERPSTSHQTNQNPVTSLETAGVHSQRSVEPRSSSYNVTGQSRPTAEYSTTSKRHPDNPRLPIADLAHPTAPIPAPRRTVHTDTTPTQYPSSTNYSNSQTFLTQDHPGNRQTPQPTPQSSRSSYLPNSNQPLHSSSSSTNLPPGASHRVASNSQSYYANIDNTGAGLSQQANALFNHLSRGHPIPAPRRVGHHGSDVAQHREGPSSGNNVS